MHQKRLYKNCIPSVSLIDWLHIMHSILCSHVFIAVTAMERDNKAFKCRMYEAELPAVNDIVAACVVDIGDIYATCKLLEYNNAEAMLPFSELSRKRIRAVSQHIKRGQILPLCVLRVLSTGAVDVSKKCVMPEEAKRCMEHFHKCKRLQSVMTQLAVSGAMPAASTTEDACRLVSWPLYARCHSTSQRSHPWDELQRHSDNAEKFMEFVGAQLPEGVCASLLAEVHKRGDSAKKRHVRCKVCVNCFTPDGIDAIQATLAAGLRVLHDCEHTLEGNLRLIASPTFLMTLTLKEGTKSSLGMQTMKAAYAAMQSVACQTGATVDLKKEATFCDKDELDNLHNSDDDKEDAPGIQLGSSEDSLDDLDDETYAALDDISPFDEQ